MKTGIFFYYQKGERLKDFPQALEGILEKENVFLHDAFYPSKPPSSFDLDPISGEILHDVHSPEMVEQVKRTGNFDGGCYFNGAAIAIRELRKKFGVNRFAIIDTDAHHGDGTWEIFESDPDVLYVCFCGYPFSEENNNVNIQVPVRVKDEEYLRCIKEGFLLRAKTFQPGILFWNWGYDGTQGEYGDIGLSPDVHILLANELKTVADEICQGRLIIVLCGGSRRDLAHYLIPPIIKILTERDITERF